MTQPQAQPAQAAEAGSDEVQRALAFILRSTQARPQTEAEIAAKLRGRDVDDDVAAAALAKAKEFRAIDDAAFARGWVEDRGRKRGFGAARLRRELERRQVPDHLAEDALAALDARDDEAAATQLAQTRAAHMPEALPPETVARRLVGFLARRGYPKGLAQRVAISVSGLDRNWD